MSEFTKINRINLMLPTYKRTTGLWRFIDSALQCASDVQNLYFTFCVNERDQDTKDYLDFRYFPIKEHIDIVLENSDQPNLSKYWNMIYEQTKFQGDNALVSMVADDMIVRTSGWDAAFMEHANDTKGKCIMHCNDAYIAGSALSVQLFIPRPLVRATKQDFMCPFYHADMIDQIWYWIGEMTNTLQYFEDIYIEHNHCTRKHGSEWDVTAKNLQPLRAIANKNKHIGVQYAARSAANMIEAGYGEWNKL